MVSEAKLWFNRSSIPDWNPIRNRPRWIRNKKLLVTNSFCTKEHSTNVYLITIWALYRWFELSVKEIDNNRVIPQYMVPPCLCCYHLNETENREWNRTESGSEINCVKWQETRYTVNNLKTTTLFIAVVPILISDHLPQSRKSGSVFQIHDIHIFLFQV